MKVPGVSVLIFLVTLLNIGLGFFTLKKGPKRKTNILFFSICLSLSVWTASHAIALTANTNTLALFWTRMIMIGATFLPWTFSWFANVFKDDNYHLPRPLLMFHMLFVVFFLMNLFSPAMIREAHITKSGIDWQGGWIFNAYLAYYALFMGYGIYIIAKKLRGASGLLHAQLGYVLFGAFTSIAFGFVTSIFFPILGITQLNKYGPVGTILMIGSFSYAIVRYRLMDLRVFLRETARYLLSAGSLSFLLSFIVVVATGDLRLGALVFILSLTLPFIQRWLNTWIMTELSRRGLLGKKEVKKVKSLADRIQESGYKISDLADTASQITFDEVPSSTCTLFIIDHDKGQFGLEGQAGDIKQFNRSISMSDPLINYLESKKEALVRGEAQNFLSKEEFEPLAKTFDSVNAEVAAPLVVLDRVAGLLFLGPKTDGKPYFTNEINQVEEITKEASTALRYVLAVAKAASETKRWAHSLNQSLKPLSQGFEVLQEDDPLIEKDPDRAEVYRRIKRPLKRLADFLYYLTHQSRIIDEELRNKYESVPLDLSEVIGKGISLQKFSASKKNIRVEVNIPNPDGNIRGNKRDLISVFEALASNALRYVREKGSIKIIGNQRNGLYTIQFENDGPSIPKEHLETIFNEGFQLKNGQEGAAGLGLANAKRIIQMHGGKIFAEDTGNKAGARFIIELPIN